MKRAETQLVTLDLPEPISTNRIWRNIVVNGKPRTLKSAEYRAWQEEAGLRLSSQRPGCVNGAFALTIRVSHKWRCDLDNAVKCTSDLLQSHGVITNDRLAQRILIERSPEIEGMRVMVASTREVAK